MQYTTQDVPREMKSIYPDSANHSSSSAETTLPMSQTADNQECRADTQIDHPETIPDDQRHVSPYSTREKIGRLLWAIVQATLYRWSFPTWYGYRLMILRLFGANVHSSCRFRRLTRFECPWNLTAGKNCSAGDRAMLYCLGPVTLGDRVSISQNAHICAGTHDITRSDLPLVRPPITIGDDTWIAADAFVGPGITIGERVILGARGCAFTNLESDWIYGGNPAKKLKPRPPVSA